MKIIKNNEELTSYMRGKRNCKIYLDWNMFGIVNNLNLQIAADSNIELIIGGF